MFCSVRFGSVRFGSVRFGSVRFGSVRFGSVLFGSVLFCSVRFGSVRSGSVGVYLIKFATEGRNISSYASLKVEVGWVGLGVTGWFVESGWVDENNYLLF